MIALVGLFWIAAMDPAGGATLGPHGGTRHAVPAAAPRATGASVEARHVRAEAFTPAERTAYAASLARFEEVVQAAQGDDAATNEADQAASLITSATRGVVGSAHDFSGITGRVSDACSACHVPHVQAVQPRSRGGNEALLDLFRVGDQREVLVPGRYMPGASSLICLSCHNGTVASSTVGTAHAILAGHRTGFDLGDGFAARDHPIGIPYPATNAEYRPLGSVQGISGLRMPEGRIECITCHDPHNAAGVPYMLSMSNERSALCLACHIK